MAGESSATCFAITANWDCGGGGFPPRYMFRPWDRNKLKGFQLKKIRKYNIQAWATIPITENGFVDMRLFTGKDDKILEFTMQYIRVY